VAEKRKLAAILAADVVRLAPGSADVAQLAGFIVLPSGYAEEAVALCEKSMTLSPNRAGSKKFDNPLR